MTLVAGGLRLELPAGWEARVRRQAPSQAGRPANVLLHAATIALPEERGDFGSGVVERLGPDDAFIAMLEYDDRDADKVLFRLPRVPVPKPSDFSPDVLQRTRAGNTGAQWFFSVSGRPFSLHAVLGSHARRAPGATRVAQLLTGLTVGHRT
ncbi:MAG: hypothetical protein QOE99_1929 [Actinomycetota bacterium]|jgi:hypothetical protein|nr:hypothetical protein [Actinomycetota bacterium]